MVFFQLAFYFITGKVLNISHNPGILELSENIVPKSLGFKMNTLGLREVTQLSYAG